MRWPVDLKKLSPLLLHGSGALDLAHEAAEFLLFQGARIVAVDGANAFDAYHLARAAQKRRRPAPSLLAAIRVSRAFTWQQFEALLERETAAEAARAGARWALVLGPLDLLADQEVKPFQAWRAARRVANALDALAATGLGVVVAQRPEPLRSGGREELIEFLHRACGHVVEVGRKDKDANGVLAAAEPSAPRAIPLPDARQLVLPFAPASSL